MFSELNLPKQVNHENAKVRKHEIEDLLVGDFRFVFSFFRGFVIAFSPLDKLAGKAPSLQTFSEQQSRTSSRRCEALTSSK